MNIAIVPARGGSKRIPRKNIKEFCGAPLISYSLNIARECGLFDAIVVSTDDDEIANIAKDYGADIPFMRPVELADDYAGTMAVIKHAIENISDVYSKPESVCCIYPTAPFLNSEDIVQTLSILKSENLNYVFSASRFDYPIQRAIRINGRSIEMVSPEFRQTRSQDLEEVYHDAGQFYWGATEAWLQGLDVFGENSQLYPLPRYRCIDIDTEEDWVLAELMYSALSRRL